MTALFSIVGVVGLGGLAFLFALWLAEQRGYDRAQREADAESAKNLRERAKVDDEIRNLTPDDALRRFDDSGWLSNDKR